MTVIPCIFIRRGEYGDFEAMIQDPEYDDALFIFNDNEVEHTTSRRGAGNAVIRPYNKYGRPDYPRSAGIPTGYSRRSGGYKTLSPSAKLAIDKAVDEIVDLIYKHNYKRIYFSADPPIGDERAQLGTAIFRVGRDVRKYITNTLYWQDRDSS